MVCGVREHATFSFNNDLACYPLLALQRIDGSGIPVNKSHLNELKRLNLKIEFSKLAVTGAGIPGGPGAFSWIIIESTMTNGERLNDLGVCITGLMNHFDADLPFNDPLVQFTSGDNDGILLVGENNIYVATIKHQQVLNCYNPRPNAAISATVPTLITNVNYRQRGFLDDDLTPFDNAKAVVAKALGAVAAGTMLDRVQIQTDGQSIRQAIEGMSWGVSGYNVMSGMSGMGGLAYIKSKKSWKILPKDAGVPECKKVPNYSRSVLESDLSTSLEKIRKKVDRIELQRYRPAQLPSAQDRFAILKGIAVQLVEIVRGYTGTHLGGLGFMSFQENLGDLKTSLFNENPEAYTALQWDAKYDFYIIQFGEAVDVMLGYQGGLFKQLTAIQQAAEYCIREGSMAGGMGNCCIPKSAGEGYDASTAPPRYTAPVDTAGGNPVDPRDALQGAAGLLSKIAIMKAKLRPIARSDVDVISRDLRYSYKTGRVAIDGKKRTLTMVKIKKPGKNAVYLAMNVNVKQNWGRIGILV